MECLSGILTNRYHADSVHMYLKSHGLSTEYFVKND